MCWRRRQPLLAAPCPAPSHAINDPRGQQQAEPEQREGDKQRRVFACSLRASAEQSERSDTEGDAEGQKAAQQYGSKQYDQGFDEPHRRYPAKSPLNGMKTMMAFMVRQCCQSIDMAQPRQGRYQRRR